MHYYGHINTKLFTTAQPLLLSLLMNAIANKRPNSHEMLSNDRRVLAVILACFIGRGEQSAHTKLFQTTV